MKRLSRRSTSHVKTYAALALILGISLFLRVWGLHWGTPIAERFTTLYVDEYTALHVLSGMNPHTFQFNPHYFTDPTFFYYQVGLALQVASWMKWLTIRSDQVFYLTHVDTYTVMYLAGRFLVALYGVALTALIFLLGREVTASRAGGLLAALSYAIIPIAVVSCHVIDVGVPVTFWLGATFFCQVRALKTSNRKWVYAGALCAGLSLSTKYTAAPIVFPWLYTVWTLRKGWTSLFLPPLISLGGFLIGTPYAVLDPQHFIKALFIAGEVASGIAHRFSIVYYLTPLGDMAYSFGVPLTLLCFAGLLNRVYLRDKTAILAALFTFPYLFLVGRSNTHMLRYINEVAPFLLPFAVVPLVELLHYPSRLAKTLGYTLCILGLSQAPHSVLIDRSLASEQDPRDQASEWIRTHIPADATIGLEYEANYMSPGHLYMQFWKGTRYPLEHVRAPNYTVVIWDPKKDHWDPPVSFWAHSGLYYSANGKKNPDQAAQVLQVKSQMEAGYQPVKTFQRDMRWGPFHYTVPPSAGFDWFAFFPTITLYQKN